MDTGRRINRIQGEGWRGFREKDKEGIERRMERIQGEG